MGKPDPAKMPSSCFWFWFLVLAVELLGRKGAQAKSELTESELWILLIASPRRRAMLTWRIFGQAFASAERGIVSVTMTSVSGELLIR